MSEGLDSSLIALADWRLAFGVWRCRRLASSAYRRIGVSAPRNGSGDCPPMYLSLPEPQSLPRSCWSAASTNRSRHRVAASWRLAFSPACSRHSRTAPRRLHSMVGLASFLTVRHFSIRHARIFVWTVAATRAARAALLQTAVPIASQRVDVSARRNGSGDCPSMCLSLPEPQTLQRSCWSATTTNRSRHRVAASWRLAFGEAATQDSLGRSLAKP
jgi:hypothetical protein